MNYVVTDNGKPVSSAYASRSEARTTRDMLRLAWAKDHEGVADHIVISRADTHPKGRSY
jgi:hypothetical protein